MLDCEYDWFMGEKLGKGDFLIIHHPLIFDPTPKQQQILDLCRQKGIALLFFHTNFDFHPLGMNTSLLPLFAPTTVITNN